MWVVLRFLHCKHIFYTFRTPKGQPLLRTEMRLGECRSHDCFKVCVVVKRLIVSNIACLIFDFRKRFAFAKAAFSHSWRLILTGNLLLNNLQSNCKNRLT